MRIWYDACTGKHIRYGTAIAKRLRTLGHEVILTTREHPDTLSLAKILETELNPGLSENSNLYEVSAAAESTIDCVSEICTTQKGMDKGLNDFNPLPFPCELANAKAYARDTPSDSGESPDSVFR